MLYDCNSPLDRAALLDRAARLAQAGAVVELTEKRQRSLSQNAYLHVIISYFAARYGESPEYVKHEYFKLLVNPDIFVTGYATDRLSGRRHAAVRSSASLTVEETTRAIDRFRDWAAQKAGVYLPTPSDHAALLQCQVYASQHSNP